MCAKSIDMLLQKNEGGAYDQSLVWNVYDRTVVPHVSVTLSQDRQHDDEEMIYKSI